MEEYRRICLYGGPGSGKSQIAAWLYSGLKEKFISEDWPLHIELAQEYVKRWAYQGVDIKLFDQIYIFGKQMRTVELPLRNGVDLVITDSPMPLQVCFSHKHELPYAKELESQAMWFEMEYPGLHIFIDRGDRKYYSGGRYETEEQAKALDVLFQEKIDGMFSNSDYLDRFKHQPELVRYNHSEKDLILDYVLDKIS